MEIMNLISLIGLNTHHEEAKIELILSNKANGNKEWKRFARFHLWV